jgi:hypothetical protein
MTNDLPDWTRSVSVQVDVDSPPAFWPGRTKEYEDTSFVTGESPRVLDVLTDLGRNGHDGYIVNDGDGDIKLEISDDGTSYGGQHTIEKDEVFDLYMLDIAKIRLTWVADSSYRVLVV